VFALQSSPPPLGPPLLALAVLLVAGVAVGALGSAVARRLSNPVGKYRLFYAGVLVPVALLAYVVLALLGFGAALVAPAIPGSSGPVGTVFGSFLEVLAAGVVWLAAYAPTVRGVRAVRDVDLSTTRALARMARYVLGVSLVVALALSLLRLAPAGGSPVVLAAGVALLATGFVVASPWLLAALRSTSEPTGPTADRIDALRARAGLDVRDVRVLDTADEETAEVVVRGPPGYGRLFVASTFLERFDDRVATALLAVQAGRVRSRVLVRRTATVVVAAGPLVAAVTGDGPRWLLLGLAAVAVVVGLRLTRSGIHAADAYAAEQVGATAVADALERYADVHGMEPARRRIPNPLSVSVPLGDRIDRLRERVDARAGEGG